MPAPREELEELLRRLERAQEALAEAMAQADPQRFQRRSPEGESIKRVLERAVDDVNLYYGRLVAGALSLPQPPRPQLAQFATLSEASASLQEAHRRFAALLHDLRPSDLERRVRDQEQAAYTLRQLLEMATAHYQLRAQQVRNLSHLPEGGAK